MLFLCYIIYTCTCFILNCITFYILNYVLKFGPNDNDILAKSPLPLFCAK